MRKGVYPYKYVDCCYKKDEQQIQHKESFNSKRPDTYISEEDNQHALKVFEIFKCATMRINKNIFMMRIQSFSSFSSPNLHYFLTYV